MLVPLHQKSVGPRQDGRPYLKHYRFVTIALERKSERLCPEPGGKGKRMQAQPWKSTTYFCGILDDVPPLIFFASVLLLVNESQIVSLIDIQELLEVTAAKRVPGKVATMLSYYRNAGCGTTAFHW